MLKNCFKCVVVKPKKIFLFYFLRLAPWRSALLSYSSSHHNSSTRYNNRWIIFCFSVPLVVHFNWLKFLLLPSWAISFFKCILRDSRQRSRYEAFKIIGTRNPTLPKIKVCDSTQSSNFLRRIVLARASHYFKAIKNQSQKKNSKTRVQTLDLEHE